MDSTSITFGVCVGGALVEDGEFTTLDAAGKRAVAEFRNLGGNGDEPVQILVWPSD
jgi:hypothetical protein